MAAGPADDGRPDEAGPPKQGPPQPKDPPPKDDQPAQGQDHDQKKKKKSPFKNPVVLIVGGLVLVLIAVGGLIFWLHARNFESTDDAFVDVQIVRIAPQISGQVTQVLVNDNQRVSPGERMVEIDSAQVETQVADAQAKKAQAQSQVDDSRVQIAVAEAARQQAAADVASARAQADNAARDLARYTGLQQTNAAAVSQQQLDQANAQARTTAAQLLAMQKAEASKAQQVRAAKVQVSSGQEQVKAAQAELQAANINYGYAHITAPVAGTIAQKTVQQGNYVQPGSQLMAIVPLQVWITANYKETQLELMRPGQKATIKVDACPKAQVEGHVDSIQRGAGQAFAILPPENATGNYVKVVQRVPVKIIIDSAPRTCQIGPGMSVEPKVRVRD